MEEVAREGGSWMRIGAVAHLWENMFWKGVGREGANKLGVASESKPATKNQGADGERRFAFERPASVQAEDSQEPKK
jgi:hypothetical protein